MRTQSATFLGVILAAGVAGGLVMASANPPPDHPISTLVSAEQQQIAACMSKAGQKYSPYSPAAAQLAALAEAAGSLTELTERSKQTLNALPVNPNRAYLANSPDAEKWFADFARCQNAAQQASADAVAAIFAAQDDKALTRGLKRSQVFSPGTAPVPPAPGPDPQAGPKTGSVAKGNSAVSRFAVNRNRVQSALATYQLCVQKAGLPAKNRDDFNNRYTFSQAPGVPRGVGYRAVSTFINRAIDVQERCYQPVQQAYDDALGLLVD